MGNRRRTGAELCQGKARLDRPPFHVLHVGQRPRRRQLGRGHPRRRRAVQAEEPLQRLAARQRLQLRLRRGRPRRLVRHLLRGAIELRDIACCPQRPGGVACGGERVQGPVRKRPAGLRSLPGVKGGAHALAQRDGGARRAELLGLQLGLALRPTRRGEDGLRDVVLEQVVRLQASPGCATPAEVELQRRVGEGAGLIRPAARHRHLPQHGAQLPVLQERNPYRAVRGERAVKELAHLRVGQRVGRARPARPGAGRAPAPRRARGRGGCSTTTRRRALPAHRRRLARR